jgi:hypothetical protein
VRVAERAIEFGEARRQLFELVDNGIFHGRTKSGGSTTAALL